MPKKEPTTAEGVFAKLEQRESDPASSESSLRYMPGLDVVRGLAITLVLVFHGLANSESFKSLSLHGLRGLGRVLSYGFLGVHLFFVLSGFLITGILLDSRHRSDYFRNFYTRRALRILPAYLLMVTVLKLSQRITWRFTAICLLYFSNMTGLLGGTPEYGSFWSLSVEEQFYLTWPLIVRKVSPRRLLWVALLVVLFTPVLRFLLLQGPAAIADIQYKTWVVADFFAAGGILAIVARRRELRQRMPMAAFFLLVAGCASLAAYNFVPTWRHKLERDVMAALMLEPWLMIWTGLTLVAFLYPGPARSLALRPMVFLAEISYGLYLCHELIFTTINSHWALNISAHPSALWEVGARFLAESAVAIAIAWVSRRTFEEFFLRLKPKHHVEFSKPS